MAMRLVHIVIASALMLASCGQSAETAATKGPAQVDGARIANADSEPGKWMSVGRTYHEQRFSPLKTINDTNAAQLGLTWSFDLDTARGQEATPLVVDGVMYFSTAWSMVKALDAKTGALKWAIRSESAARIRRRRSAATSSIAASRCGTARSMSARSTGG